MKCVIYLVYVWIHIPNHCRCTHGICKWMLWCLKPYVQSVLELVKTYPSDIYVSNFVPK